MLTSRATTRPLTRPRSLGLLAAAVLAAFAGSALLAGSHARSAPRFSVRAAAPAAQTRDPLPERVLTVLGTSTPARIYGEADALRENDGEDLQHHLTSDLTPVAPARIQRAIARYRVYALRWAHVLAARVSALSVALAAGERARAQALWRLAFYAYMRLGADYNLLPARLTNQIAEVPRSLGQRHFPGLHRIELGLWRGQPLRELVGVANGVAAATRTLERELPRLPIGTLAYTLRIHEILEDAQRDLLSGTEVPWSGAGVLATEAGVLTTRELLSTVRPIIAGRDNVYGQSENALDLLQQALVAVRRADHGWPALSRLTMAQRERIDAAMAGALAALQYVPGALETRTIDSFPSIPRAPLSRKRRRGGRR